MGTSTFANQSRNRNEAVVFSQNRRRLQNNLFCWLTTEIYNFFDDDNDGSWCGEERGEQKWIWNNNNTDGMRRWH